MTAARPVVVVGAGPVGLITALGLVHYGLDVVVLEEDTELSRETKAGTLLTRTVEVLDRYGVADDVLAQALRIDEIGDVDRASGQTLRSIKTWLLRDDTRYPFVVNIPQHVLEPVLAGALAVRAPGALRLGHRVMAFDAREDHVMVSAQAENGSVEIEASYLLACDGGRSTIRKGLGVGVSGTTFPERYMLVDVAVDLDVANPRDYPYLAYFADPEEWMVLVRQPEFWRFLYPRKADSPGFDQSALATKARQYIGDVDRLEVMGSYEYTVHARSVDRWRDGRVFLMGDAAHLITPMWALGLNTGVLDASNLPWRLAWVARGWAEPSLLDGYEREQGPLARHGSAAMAEAASEYMARRSQSLAAMTDHDWANAMTRSMLAVRLDVAGTGEWALTPDGPALSPLRVGDRIPDMVLRRNEGTVSTHQLVADRFVAFHFTDARRRPTIPDSTTALGHFVVSRWDATLDGGRRERTLLDVGSLVQARFGCAPDTTVLVRPDGHVAATAPMGGGVAEDVYRTITGRPSTTEEI